MKTAKKLLVLLLTVLIFATSSIICFASATPEVTEAKAGSVVTVVFSYKDVAGIRGTLSISGDDIIKDIAIENGGTGFEGSYNADKKILAYYAASAAEFNCTLKITIADTAVLGNECKIAFEYESTADGKLPATPSYQYDYATIKIVIDYTELNEQIDIANKLKKDDYTEDSWKVLETALTNANAATKATTQPEVDAAAKALKDAIAALKAKPGVVINYDELNKQIDIAEKLNKDDYTEDSWKVLEQKLKEAIEARKATAQPAVDAAAKALEDAIAALEKKPVVVINYDELNKQIDIAQKLNEDEYTEDSWKVLEDALKDAVEARNATTQSAVDTAAKTLADAIAALEKKPVVNEIDYTELNEQIDIAQGLKKDTYTDESWKDLEAALKKAIEARNADTQTEVDNATQELKSAIDALELKKITPPDAGDTMVVFPFAIFAATLVAFYVFRSRKKAENR